MLLYEPARAALLTAGSLAAVAYAGFCAGTCAGQAAACCRRSRGRRDRILAIAAGTISAVLWLGVAGGVAWLALSTVPRASR
jgi:hypothetical protein